MQLSAEESDINQDSQDDGYGKYSEDGDYHPGNDEERVTEIHISQSDTLVLSPLRIRSSVRRRGLLALVPAGGLLRSRGFLGLLVSS